MWVNWQLSEVLYGLLQSALLLYKKFSKYLEAYGNVINNYYPCVANSMIDGHQMTVTWYTDYLKVYHNDPYHITKFSSYLSSIYGEKLIIKWGKVHEYLGKDIDYSEKVSVKVSIVKYIGKILRVFP